MRTGGAGHHSPFVGYDGVDLSLDQLTDDRKGRMLPFVYDPAYAFTGCSSVRGSEASLRGRRLAGDVDRICRRRGSRLWNHHFVFRSSF